MITLEEEHKRAETKRRKRQSTRFTTIVKQNILRVRGRHSAQKKRKVCDSDDGEDDDLMVVSMSGKSVGSRKTSPAGGSTKTPKMNKKAVFLTRLIVEKKRFLPSLCGKYAIHDRRALEDEIQTLQKELDDCVRQQQNVGNQRENVKQEGGIHLKREGEIQVNQEDEQDETQHQDMRERRGEHGSSFTTANELECPYADGEGSHIEIVDVDTCLRCNRRLLHKQADAKLVCPQCGVSVDYAPSTNAGVAFGEDVEISVHAYERVKHFKTNLQQFSVEAPAIPAEVVERVHKGYARLHVKSVHEVRATPVKEVLKSLGLSDWRNFSSRITNLMNGVPSALFTPDEIKEMLQMFMEIQPIFASVKTRVRKNFLNTNYLLNKFCRIKGWPQRAQCFSLMKDGAVLQKQDCTFRRMCRKKGWKFFSSI